MDNPSGGKMTDAPRLVVSQGVDRAGFNTIPYQKKRRLLASSSCQKTQRLSPRIYGTASAPGAPMRCLRAEAEPHTNAMIVSKNGIICRKKTRL